ncbi:MAG: ATP-binding protein [Cyclobacteriaceae bacterium]
MPLSRWALIDWHFIEEWRNMVFNRFAIFLLIRVLLLLAVLIGLASIFGREELFFTQVLLAIVVLGLAYELLWFVNRTNRHLNRFLMAVFDKDMTAKFNEKDMSESFNQLNQSFIKVVQEIKTAKLEREAQYQYLKKIIDHIDLGIISLNDRDEIELINTKAADLLRIPEVKSWQLLKNHNTAFFEAIQHFDQVSNRLLEININGEFKQLSVTISQLKLLGITYRIITFKDIKTEIAQKEIEAWHKLIRILTHEIMNSVTPIASMTETVQMLLNENGKVKGVSDLTDEQLEDIAFSLDTINNRAEGLLHFVSDYRKLTKIPTPVSEELNIELLFKQVLQLEDSAIKKANILTSTSIRQQTLKADPALISQVLINLVKNAIEAFEQVDSAREKSIGLSTETTNGFDIICVSDNGSGINEDKMEKIFIPFFSTKDDGSGIGLSLSRQILNLHGGYLEVKSEVGVGTEFRLYLPK